VIYSSPSPLQAAWLAEAIRLHEEQAPLEDHAACRLAQAAGGNLPERLLQRAAHLAQREGLTAALQHVRQGSRLALALLALLALLGGAGLAATALGEGSRPVNLLWALGSLLGAHLLTLAGWLLAASHRGRGHLLTSIWQGLARLLAREPRSALLMPALLLLLERARLGRWALGLLSHGLWLLALGSALLTLLAMLSARRYGFVWETTLLPSASLIGLVETLGALPAWLGFAQPDAALLRASLEAAASGEAARQTWASWLLGMLLIYGLLPRLLLLLLCLLQWRRGQRRLQPDPALPGYARLHERLLPSSERLAVEQPAPARLLPGQPGHADLPGRGALLVAIELDPSDPWPPTLPKGVTDGGVLDDSPQRRTLLAQLSQAPVARLLLVCDPRRSPDRGTLALLTELAGHAGEARVWLLPATSGHDLDARRLSDWQETLQQLALPASLQAPWDWLAGAASPPSA
jgi:hypothetical protein